MQIGFYKWIYLKDYRYLGAKIIVYIQFVIQG